MKHVIHKHDLWDPVTDLTLSVRASILFVGVQGMSIRLWEMHNAEEKEQEVRTFEIVATGQRTKADPIQYVGSVMLDEGRHVFHVFETTIYQREPLGTVTWQTFQGRGHKTGMSLSTSVMTGGGHEPWPYQLPPGGG